MSESDVTLQRAHDATARGDWHAAFDLFSHADRDGLLAPPDLPVYADAAYGAGHLDVTIEAWERVHVACTRVGDHAAAAGAAVRVAMHLLFDTALMAPVRGWLARAERLLDGQDETPANAWYAVVRTYERMLTGDEEGARLWADRAIDVGSRADAAACAVGRVAQARLLILDGDVERGLALLDEAGVAAVSGDLDPLSTGIVYCELVCALQGLAQYDLAEQWTEAMERWSQSDAVGSLHGRCRVHRAEILRLRGLCPEAELEARLACEELEPYLRREMGWPLSELGQIRLRRGDIDGAEEALVAAHDAGWDPQPGLALVRLAQGDVAGAAGSIQEALEGPLRVPSKERPPNSGLQRAPLLEAQVQIGIAAGDIDRARSAADELGEVAARFQSKALRASAALCHARVRFVEGDFVDASRLYSDAARLWNEIGAPYETAIARTGLAEALQASGDTQQSVMVLHAARAFLDALEIAPDRSPAVDREAGRAMPEAAGDEVNAFRREGDYWLVAFGGLTVRMRDLKGMQRLARLLEEPGRELHVLDLVAAENGSGTAIEDGRGPSFITLGDAGEHLDAQAKAAYRRRLTEIDEDIEEARSTGDGERAAQAEAERDFLIRELSRAVGLGGRDRRAGSTSERARVRVTRSLRQAMVPIGERHPQLGAHLDRSIHTGTYCSYLPDPPVRWNPRSS